jgi:hypothetical protein
MLEPFGELGDAARATRRFFRQAAQQQVVPRLRNVRPSARRRRHERELIVQHGAAAGHERQTERAELVQNNSQGIYLRALVSALAEDALGREIFTRADDCSRFADAGLARVEPELTRRSERLRGAEIEREHAGRALVFEQRQVLRLQVAVQDVCGEDLSRALQQRLGDGQRVLQRWEVRPLLEPGGERGRG